MADVQAPTAIVNTQQSINSIDFIARQNAERLLLQEMEIRLNALESTPDGHGRGYEVR